MTATSGAYCAAMPHSANPAPWVNMRPALCRASARPRSGSGVTSMSSPSRPAAQAEPSPEVTRSAIAGPRRGLAANPISGQNTSRPAGTMMRRCSRTGSRRATMTSATTVPAGIPMSRKPAARAGWPMWVA
jgi:hypothetical protein